MRLAGKVVLITGGAGGIGRALAAAFARRGCALALVDIDLQGLEQVQRPLVEAGTRVSIHTADVSNVSTLERVRDEVLAEHGHLHVLVNNAGVTIYGLFEHYAPAEIERIVGINFWGVLNGCRVFLPVLRSEPEAHVVNVSSMAGAVGMPLQSLYCATKFAVRGFTESLRAELSDSAIGVTCVMPGTTRSNILASARSTDPALTKQLGELLARRGPSPDKLARRIAWAVRWNWAEVRAAADSHLLDLGKRLSPGLMRWMMRLVFRAAKWKSRSSSAP